MAALKTKYKMKIVTKVSAASEELSLKLTTSESALRYTKETLTARLAELEVLTVRVEQLEMSQSTNSVQVEDIQNRHRVIISQMKAEHQRHFEKFDLRVQEVQKREAKLLI